MNEHIADERLHDFVDGHLGDEDATGVERHLASCETCATRAAELATLVADLGALPLEAEPVRDLWPGIEGRIGDTGAEVIELPIRRSALPRRISATWGQLLAASIALATVSAGTVWMALRGDGAAGTTQVAEAPTMTGAVPAAQLASTRYEAAITQLEGVLEEGRSLLLPETRATLERSLEAIEAAMTEARTALEADPNNELLNRLLVGHQQSKLRVLEKAAAAIRL